MFFLFPSASPPFFRSLAVAARSNGVAGVIDHVAREFEILFCRERRRLPPCWMCLDSETEPKRVRNTHNVIGARGNVEFVGAEDSHWGRGGVRGFAVGFQHPTWNPERTGENRQLQPCSSQPPSGVRLAPVTAGCRQEDAVARRNRGARDALVDETGVVANPLRAVSHDPSFPVDTSPARPLLLGCPRRYSRSQRADYRKLVFEWHSVTPADAPAKLISGLTSRPCRCPRDSAQVDFHVNYARERFIFSR